MGGEHLGITVAGLLQLGVLYVPAEQPGLCCSLAGAWRGGCRGLAGFSGLLKKQRNPGLVDICVQHNIVWAACNKN